jgi:hypothetical protein
MVNCAQAISCSLTLVVLHTSVLCLLILRPPSRLLSTLISGKSLRRPAVWVFQCGGSGMFIPDPGSWFLPIPDLGSRIPENSNKREGWKKICCHNILYSYKSHKIANYFSLEVLKKKIWANFQRIIELFTQKIVKKFSKIWGWDPGSGIRKKPIPDPGSRGQKGTGSRIPDPDPQHWFFQWCIGNRVFLFMSDPLSKFKSIFCCCNVIALGAWFFLLHHVIKGLC